MKPKAYAVTVGTNVLDEDHYNTNYNLTTVENTANLFHELWGHYFDVNKRLHGPDATTCNFKNTVIAYASELRAGDLLVITFCGHGWPYTDAQFPEDKEDEGWGFYDRVFFDFEWWQLARCFAAGVKILLIADACNTGLVEARAEKFVTENFFERHRDTYRQLMQPLNERVMMHEVKASMVIITSSCEGKKMYETSDDYTFFGRSLKYAWEKLGNAASLQQLYQEIQLGLFFPDLITNQHTGKVDRNRYPRWHYIQGHRYTNFSDQKPIFNSTKTL
jgi:hypothetical protein